MTDAATLESLRQACGDVRLAEPLSQHTTIRIGGPADAMAFPADGGELAALLAAASGAHGLELAVLGGGANLLAHSRGFRGLVVNMARMSDFEILPDGLLVAQGGARLADLAAAAARAGFGGIDFMAEVPGTVGGAVVINAGTHVGGYVADRLEWVETVSIDGRRDRLSPGSLDFAYRSSALLHGRALVARAAFRLARCADLGQTPESLTRRFREVLDERARKFPLDLPNFGSTFRSPGAPHPPTGKILDDLGMKGAREGQAQVSEKHANFIVNLGGATSDDVVGLMGRMRQVAREERGVDLQPEVHYLADASTPRPEFFANRPTIL